VSSVIRNLLVDLKNTGRDDGLVKTLQRAFPELAEMAIEFEDDRDRYISVTYRETGWQKAFDLFSAGSGFQQFIYLFGFALLRQPSVVLLDEPDVHLHGSLQQVLLRELRELVGTGKQVLFATHSPDLIRFMEPRQVLELGEREARLLSVNHEVYDVLENLGSLDPTELPKIQRFRRVLVVENKSDFELISVFCATFLGPGLWQQIHRRLAVCYAQGNPRRQEMHLLRDQMHQMMGTSDEPLRMFVVADRDYYPYLGSLQGQLEKWPHIQWHIWERTEIENYLLSVSGLSRMAKDPDFRLDLLEEQLPLEKIRQKNYIIK